MSESGRVTTARPACSRADTFDLEEFLARIKRTEAAILPDGSFLFGQGVPLVVARAPGRLDVMGGIADYSGSLVLQLPLAEATLAAVQAADDGQLRIASLGEASATTRTAALPCSEITALAQQGYPAAREYFHRKPTTAWAAYVAGVVVVLLRECRLACDRFGGNGLRILVSSDVPEGKGVSSSAALEVAAMQ